MWNNPDTGKVWRFYKNLNMQLPYNLVITFLGIYPREVKIYAHIKTCTGIFIAALFVVTLNHKQPRCSSKNKWLNKLWYIPTQQLRGRTYWYLQHSLDESPEYYAKWKKKPIPKWLHTLWLHWHNILKISKLWN